MSSRRINMNRRQLYCRCFKLALDVFVCLFACVTELTDSWGASSLPMMRRYERSPDCEMSSASARRPPPETKTRWDYVCVCVQCSAESKVQPFSFHVCRIFHSCRVFPLMSANKDKLVLYLPFESSSASGEQRENSWYRILRLSLNSTLTALHCR